MHECITMYPCTVWGDVLIHIYTYILYTSTYVPEIVGISTHAHGGCDIMNTHMCLCMHIDMYMCICVGDAMCYIVAEIQTYKPKP